MANAPEPTESNSGSVVMLCAPFIASGPPTSAAEGCPTPAPPQCLAFMLSHGIRTGGGVAELMSFRRFGEPHYMSRLLWDTLFYIIVVVILLNNSVFGIIMDTFAGVCLCRASPNRHATSVGQGNWFSVGIQPVPKAPQ